MIRWIYNLCFPLFLVVSLPGYIRRMVRRGNYRRDFWQRFGFFQPEAQASLAKLSGCLWLQAVSVGEMLVALKLVAALRVREPGLPLVLSTTTTTGYQLARQRAPEDVPVIYTPIDLPGAVRRTFRVLRPSQLVIVDGGLWPNQLWEARRRRVGTALVNARLSPRSEGRFRRFRRVAASVFGLLDLVAVPGEADLERWGSLGVSQENLRMTGSIKFDDSRAGDDSPGRAKGLRGLLMEAGASADAPVLLCGSTHPGEEKIMGGVYQELRRKYGNLYLVVAPRHVERSDAVHADLEAVGLRVVRRTSLTGGNRSDQADVLLLDTTGELRDWYEAADIVFIGKSLTVNGGQNPAEAVAAGKPVVFGPHMENFADFVAALLAVDGAVQVRDADGLSAACRRLLEEPARAQEMAARARRQLDAHRGAAGRTADLLLAQTKISAC